MPDFTERTEFYIVLVYLLRRPVARVFQLGRGDVTLPDAEADVVERVIGGRPW